jgi:hypothetical protein
VRPLTVPETAVLASVVASALCVVVPAFFRNVHASRLVEPMDGLEQISARCIALSLGRPTETAFPPSAPLTPATVPRGEVVEDPPGTWDHPTWRELDFRIETPHSFSFAFESRNGPEESTFRAVAHGDLDGDGSQSTFSISGGVRRGEAPFRNPIEIHREVE